MYKTALISIALWPLIGCQATPELSVEEVEIAELNELIQHPEKFQKKCRETTNKIVKERCKRIKRRPHLFQKNPNVKSKAKNRPAATTIATSSYYE